MQSQYMAKSGTVSSRQVGSWIYCVADFVGGNQNVRLEHLQRHQGIRFDHVKVAFRQTVQR